MKLVFFTHGGILYGANLSMIDLIVGLRACGVDCLVVHANRGPIEDRLQQLGIPAECIPFKMCVHWRSPRSLWHPRRWASEGVNMIRALQNQRFNDGQVRQLARAAHEFGADAIVSNSSNTVIGLAVAKQLHLPHIWHIREFGDLDWDYFPDFGFGRRRNQIQQSAKVICVSEAVAAHFKTQCGLIQDANFVALHDSIASSAELAMRSEATRASNPENTRPFTFVITGFVKYSKGQFDAVSALAILVNRGLNARLVVAGQGATDELRALAQSLGVADDVDVCGHIADLSQIYQQADCGLMCSVAEGFGRVTAEYMSWGKPVIGRSSGATPEIVRHEVNGLLYDGSIESLACCMERLILDHTLLQRLGEEALICAGRYFSHDTNASAFFREVRSGIAAAKPARESRI